MNEPPKEMPFKQIMELITKPSVVDHRPPRLPTGVHEVCGIFTKENSDLFIDRDMTPNALRMIANYIERNENKIQKTSS
jgi:hypothetical protein